MSTGQHPKTPDERIDDEASYQEAKLAEIKALTEEELEERLKAIEQTMNEYQIQPDGAVFMGVKLDAIVDLLTDMGMVDKDQANRYFRDRLLQSFEMNVERMIPMIEERRRQEARARIIPANGHFPRIDPLA